MICINDMDDMKINSKYELIARFFIVAMLVLSLVVLFGSESFADDCHDDEEAECSHYCDCLICNSHIYVIYSDIYSSSVIYHNISLSNTDQPSQYEQELCSRIDRPPKSC